MSTGICNVGNQRNTYMANVSGISSTTEESSFHVGGTGTWQPVQVTPNIEKNTKIFGGFKSIPASMATRNLFLQAQQEQSENENAMAKSTTEGSQNKSSNILTSKDINIPPNQSHTVKTVPLLNLDQQVIDTGEEKQDIERDVFFSGMILFLINFLIP